MMRIHIAICDDDIDMVQSLRKIIEDYNRKKEYNAVYAEFQDGKQLIEELSKGNKEYDVILLDVEMPGMTGFDVAKLIKEGNLNSCIIFVSSHGEWVFDSFEYEPVHFVRKESIKIELPLVLERAYARVKRNKSDDIVLDDGNRTIKTKKKEIVCFEVEKHYVVFYLANGEMVKLRKTFKELINTFDEEEFVVVNRGACANIAYIKEIDKYNILLENGKRIGGTAHAIEAIKIKYVKYWRD